MTASTPVWSPDGKRLYFAFTNRIFSAAVQMTPVFTAGQPVEIKLPVTMPSKAEMRHFDLMPDGKRFLVVLPEATATRVTIPAADHRRLNWIDELKAKTSRRD